MTVNAEAFRRDTLMFDEWQRKLESEGDTPVIPAATVVVLRDRAEGLQSLMLRRNSKIAFGGMWVFPGGRIDPADHVDAAQLIVAARNAAAREAHEEASIVVDPAELVHFSFWLPPLIAPKRFATWFFAVRAPATEVSIDDSEIVNHEWMTPADAMQRRDAGEIELIAPTWVTLHTMSRFGSVDDALTSLREQAPRSYETRMGRGEQGPVSMWHGDAGYETSDPMASGPRHRLEITPNGYAFDESGYAAPEQAL